MTDGIEAGGRPKIFGVGFQRTGTRSLADACEVLGWKALHGDYGRFPGGLDLNDPIYGQFEMFCDTPFFPLYEKLDRRFPGAKFILTERDPEKWIESVRWLYERNRDFESYPTVRLHHVVTYGTSAFEPEPMRSLYEAHNRRVKAYFKDRPGDLLVMDLTAGDGWEALCAFLECEVPPVEFPHSNERTEAEG